MTKDKTEHGGKKQEVEGCGPPDPSMITPEMRKVYLYVSNTLFEKGRRSSLEEIAQNTNLPLGDGVRRVSRRDVAFGR